VDELALDVAVLDLDVAQRRAQAGSQLMSRVPR
jgi:hypothetical protein